MVLILAGEFLDNVLKDLKSFEDVFSKIKLSANVLSVLKKTKVDKVRVSKATKAMDIVLVCDNVLNEACFVDFEEDIRSNFPFVSDVSVNIFYDIDNTLIEKVEMYRLNILNKVKRESPFCYNLLKNAKWETEENTIIINVDCRSAFLFRLLKKFLQIDLG